MLLLRSSIWLMITFLPDRWHTRAQADQTLPASAISMDSASARSTGSPIATYNAQPRWLGDPRRCVIADCLLLILAAATVAVCFANTNSIARLLLVLAAACLVPGGALLTRLPVEDALEALGLAVGLSFCIETAGALVMVWTGWWHPFGWALALATAACVMLILDLRRAVVTVRRVA
jgi:hypothetical protein